MYRAHITCPRQVCDAHVPRPRCIPALCYSLQQDGVVGDGAQLVLGVAVSDVHAVTLGLGGGLEWAPAAQRLQTGCTTNTPPHRDTSTHKPAKSPESSHKSYIPQPMALPTTRWDHMHHPTPAIATLHPQHAQ